MSSGIAPTDRGISFRLAEYTIPKGLRLALLADDTTYGREGAKAMDKAFASNPEAVALEATLPYGGADVTPQVLRARREGASGLLVWGQASTIAAVVIAARSAGWNVPCSLRRRPRIRRCANCSPTGPRGSTGSPSRPGA